MEIKLSQFIHLSRVWNLRNSWSIIVISDHTKLTCRSKSILAPFIGSVPCFCTNVWQIITCHRGPCQTHLLFLIHHLRVYFATTCQKLFPLPNAPWGSFEQTKLFLYISLPLWNDIILRFYFYLPLWILLWQYGKIVHEIVSWTSIYQVLKYLC